MELSGKLIEQIVVNTRPNIEEHMLVVMEKTTHEEHLSKPLQTNNEQLKNAVTFLTVYNGIFNVTNTNNEFYFKKTTDNEDGFIQFTILPGAYEIESINNEFKRITIDVRHYTEANYPFTIKPKFSTLGSSIENSPQRPILSFMFADSIKNFSGFHAITLYEEYNLSTNAADILSFDNIFLECNIAQGMIFKGKRSGVIHNFTMEVVSVYKYIEKFRCGVQWFMMESKDLFSNICFKLKNENNQLVSFNGQRITFRLSNKEI